MSDLIAMRDRIRRILDFHEAMTRIVFTDTDDRVGYICECGATDEGSGFVGRAWIVQHQTEEVIKALHQVDTVQTT
jgi:hypothetical protein